MKSTDNRSRLVQAARKLFAARGYADVSVDEIATAAGLTKGAVYYQFTDKTDLFRAACDSVLDDIMAHVTAETMNHVSHAVDEIVTGGDILFDAYESKDARRLLLMDGPSVLGHVQWTAMQEKLRIGLGEHALNHLVDEGLLAKRMVPMMAHLLFGAFTQGALQIAFADDAAAASKQARAAYKRLAQGLLAPAA
jgi:AcrR family transcriptional regulator